jgi:ferredoxin, 2Fe-2S
MEALHMAILRFKGYGEAHAKPGTTILEAARSIGAPEGSDCGGCCSCSTCHVYVVSGAHLLSPKEDEELDILELADEVREASSRLGCQAQVLAGDGVVAIEISKESFETFLAENPSLRSKFTSG